MAKWQELCELLMDKELTPQKILEKLRVKPYRLKQMLESKRLAERLGLLEQIAAMRADHAILLAVAAAADKLAALAANDTETGRKACLDVLAQGRLVRTERHSARAGSRLANWHNDFRRWERKEKRKAQREGRPRNTACEQAVPPEEAGSAGAAVAGDPAPDGALPPRRERRVPPPRRMSKSKRRELAGLPPEKKKRGPVTLPPPPGYRQSADFVPRPGGRVVQHLVCGKVFLGST